MNGNLGKILLAAILAVATWSAVQIRDLNSRVRTSNVPPTTFSATFKIGDKTRTVTTTRGEFDPNETVADCWRRHLANEALAEAGK